MPSKLPKKHYENNPFFIASSGITLLFNLAQGVAIMLIILSVIGLFSNAFSPGPSDTSSSNDFVGIFQGWGFEEWLLFGIATFVISLAALMITSLFAGVSAYTSAQLAHGDEVSIKVAFREAFDKLWSFIWLQIIIFVKVLLWSLLLVVPGIIMAIRYSLANVAFFDDTKNLRGNEAIKESLRLTRGAWITTYAASFLFNILTLFAISNVVSVGVNAVLYKQYQEAGDKKPDAHWLSWVTLVMPFALLGFIIAGLIVAGVIIGLTGYKAH
jgi:hypothetical protein